MPQGVWDSVALKSAEHCITITIIPSFYLIIGDDTILIGMQGSDLSHIIRAVKPHPVYSLDPEDVVHTSRR